MATKPARPMTPAARVREARKTLTKVLTLLDQPPIGWNNSVVSLTDWLETHREVKAEVERALELLG